MLREQSLPSLSTGFRSVARVIAPVDNGPSQHAAPLMNPSPLIDLGSVQVDPANESLLVAGESVPLRPKAFATLMMLVSNPLRIVTKDELLDEVWSDTVVGDAVLKVCVRELRKALGDSTKEPRFIETVHRRGYRFLVEPQQAPLPIEAPRAALTQPPESAALEVVGREVELGELQARWERAQAGERQVVLLSGDAGVGKTSVARTFLRSAEGCRVVLGGCREQFGAGEPFLPVLEAIGAVVGTDTDGPLVQQLREWAPTWYVQFPRLVSDEDRQRLEREILGATRERMLREMAEFLERITASEPLAMVLEDLHWSDPSTLDLVRALAQRSQPARLLVVLTYRPVDIIVRDHPLRRAKGDLLRSPSACEIPLGFLDQSGVSRFLRLRLATDELPEGLSDWLFRRTDGLPLFLVHIVDFLVDRGWLVCSEGAWTFDRRSADGAQIVPRTMREMIDEDLSQCSETERTFLEAASLAGFHFSSEAVAAALELDPAQVERMAAPLVNRRQFMEETGWVEFPDGTAGASYAFTHALWQQAMAASVSPARRTRYQRRLGERGETAFGERAHEAAAELALHFEEGRQPRKALHYALIAAARAQERCAHLEADRYLVRALALSEQLPVEERWERRSEVHLRLGLLRRAMGDMPAASEALEQWALEAQSQSDTDAEARARILCASTTSWLDKARCLDHVSRARRLESELTDPVLTAHVLGSGAYWELLWDGWKPGLEQVVREAASAAQARGDREIATQHEVRLSFFEALRGQYGQAVESARGAREAAVEVSDPSEVMLASFYGAWALLQGAQWEAAETWIRDAASSAERNGNRPWVVLFELLTARLLLHQGDIEQASRLAERGLEHARDLGMTFGVRYGSVLLATTLLERGDGDAAQAQFEQFQEQLRTGPGLLDWLSGFPCLLGLSRCALLRNDTAKAKELAESGRSQAEAMGETSFLKSFEQILSSAQS